MPLFPKNPSDDQSVTIGTKSWTFNATYGVWDKAAGSDAGPTGPTGPIGSTGAVGATGPTGATGFLTVANGLVLSGTELSISTSSDIVVQGVTCTTGIDIGSSIRHVGDLDTKVAFSTDRVTLEAGGTVYQTIGVNDCTDFNSTEVREAKLKDYSEHVNAIGTVTSNTAVNFENGNVQTVTVGGNCQFSFSNPPASGQAGTVTLIITNGGAHTTTFASAVKFPGGVAPTLTSSGVDIVSFLTTDAGTTINGFIGGINFS